MTQSTLTHRPVGDWTVPVMMNAASGSWTRPERHGSVPARTGKGSRDETERCAELRASFPDVVSIWRGKTTGSWWALSRSLNEIIEARTLEELARLLWQRLGGVVSSRRRNGHPRSRHGRVCPKAERENSPLATDEPEPARTSGGWLRRLISRIGRAA